MLFFKGINHTSTNLHYPNPTKCYIVYTDASDDAYGAQLSQEHDGMEFPIAFLSHTFMDMQHKWSTTEQEAYGVYYTVTNWNCCLQGDEVIVRNDHKPLARFLNGKNANRSSHLQHHFQMDIWSPQQSSQLPLMISRVASGHASNSQHAIHHHS